MDWICQCSIQCSQTRICATCCVNSNIVQCPMSSSADIGISQIQSLTSMFFILLSTLQSRMDQYQILFENELSDKFLAALSSNMSNFKLDVWDLKCENAKVGIWKRTLWLNFKSSLSGGKFVSRSLCLVVNFKFKLNLI